jgi:hypothetical protein
MIVRLFLVLVTLSLVISGGMYLFTRNPRYLQFAKRTLSFSVLFLAVLGVLYLLERYVLVGWRVLL